MINLSMRIICKEWSTLIPARLPEVWHFFSRPENLDRLTSSEMSFHIISDIEGQEMYEGMLIEYLVTPMLNISMYWVTEITHIQPMHFFIDEQRVGPYAMWHHEHHFTETPQGVHMIDRLYYRIGYGPLGSLANALFVERKVDNIFAYREEQIRVLFPAG